MSTLDRRGPACHEGPPTLMSSMTKLGWPRQSPYAIDTWQRFARENRRCIEKMYCVQNRSADVERHEGESYPGHFLIEKTLAPERQPRERYATCFLIGGHGPYSM